jgi:serine/threonine protein kinase
MQLKTGTALKGGEYIIESVLGQGGFGITYMAIQTGLNRKVAVKEFFMRDLCNRDESTFQVSVPSLGSRDQVARFRAKFIKEAQTIALLSHPNIIRIISVFEENGTAYYVMEYVDGGSLEQLSAPSAPMPVSMVRKYVGQVADALSYLHANNILHLDIKPSNILVSNGNAVLIDFGISKHYDAVCGGQTSTSPVGISEGYAPLEQYNKGGVSSFTPATDVYSLGATLFRLVTGQRPMGASELVTSQEGLTLPAGVPSEIAAAIKAAMCPVIGMRPQNVEKFMDILEGRVQVVQQSGVQQTSGDTMIFNESQPLPQIKRPEPPQIINDTNPKPRKKKGWGKRLAIIIAVVSVIVIGALLVIGINSDKEREDLIKENFDYYIESLVGAIKDGDEDYAIDLCFEINNYCESLTLDEQSLWDHYFDEWYNDNTNIYEAALLDDWLNTEESEVETEAVDDYSYYDYADTSDVYW